MREFFFNCIICEIYNPQQITILLASVRGKSDFAEVFRNR